MGRVAIWVLVGAAVVGAAAALWLAGEMHYRNCLARSDMTSKAAGIWSPGYTGSPRAILLPVALLRGSAQFATRRIRWQAWACRFR